MTLRLATASDIPDILRMVLDFHKVSPYADLPADPEYIQTLITGALSQSATQSIVLLSLEKDRPVGLLVAVTTQSIFNGKTIGNELLFWVDPEYRSANRAKELKGAFEYWAKEVCHVSYLAMSALEDKTLPFLHRYYKQSGLKKTEHQYLKVL